jgi:hypothetical protein
MDINIFTNKLFCNSMIKGKAINPFRFNNWSRHFNLDEKPDLSRIYSFIFYFLQENKLKIFRWKLIQYIIPTTKLLTVWRL